MKLTTKWGKSLRGVAAMVLVACALAWIGEAANASLIALTPGGLATPGGTHTMSSAPEPAPVSVGFPSGGFDVSESPYLQLTSGLHTVQTGGPTLTTTVEQGDPQNPYIGGNPGALTFIFQLTNPSTTNGLGYLTVDGFTGYSVSYGTYTTSSGLTPSPLVQLTSSPANVDLPYNNTSFVAASSSTPKVSAEVVLYTNATNYRTDLDPVTWGLVGNSMGAIYSVPSYAPAAATPEPSSLILASIGMVLFLGLGWRRRRS